jgi:tRNA-dihydrouridine synthase B
MPEPRLYMAPLKGVTDHIFRNTYGRHFPGIDLAVAPFVASINGKKINRRYIEDLLPEHNRDMPVIPQILSSSAKGFVLLANYFHDLGYKTVNWNLGCPYPMNPEKNRAAWLLPHVDRIQEFLEAVVPSLKGRISIKARLGLRDNQEFGRLIPVLNGFPIDEVILHPRTGIQRYDGKLDLQAFEECISRMKHPVVYNGDIRTIEDYQRLAVRFPAIDRWMIGRWLLVDSFLPLAIKTGRAAGQDRAEKIRMFHDDLFEQYRDVLNGPKHLLDRMKGLWQFFQFAFQDCGHGMETIRQTRHPNQYLDAVEHFFQTHTLKTVYNPESSGMIKS